MTRDPRRISIWRALAVVCAMALLVGLTATEIRATEMSAEEQKKAEADKSDKQTDADEAKKAEEKRAAKTPTETAAAAKADDPNAEDKPSFNTLEDLFAACGPETALATAPVPAEDPFVAVPKKPER